MAMANSSSKKVKKVLLDLPNEALAQIVKHVAPGAIFDPRIGAPFYYWSRNLRIQISKRHKSRSKDVCAVMLTCKRLSSIAKEGLYRHVHTIDEAWDQFPAGTLLSQQLQAKQELGRLVRTVSFQVTHEEDIKDFYHLFFLPNIETLAIQSFNSWQAMELGEPEDIATLVGSSPVQNLYLMSCEAAQAPLAQVLSWPKALKKLFYDCEEMGWDYGGGEFSLEGVTRAISSQSSSLEQFVFGRMEQPAEGLGYTDEDDCLNLSSFERLQSLCVAHVFFVGFEQDRRMRGMLPKSLVELEVFYDDTGYIDFLGPEANPPDWLFGILRDKNLETPLLKRVRIVSPETLLESCLEPPATAWTPPQEIREAFEEADVSYSIHLNFRKRYQSVARGDEFEDMWEDTWEDPANF